MRSLLVQPSDADGGREARESEVSVVSDARSFFVVQGDQSIRQPGPPAVRAKALDLEAGLVEGAPSPEAELGNCTVPSGSGSDCVSEDGAACSAPAPKAKASCQTAIKLSLRFVVLPVLVLILVAVVVVISLVNYRNADATAEMLSSQLLMQVGRRVYENVATVFIRAMRIAETNALVAAAPLAKPVMVTPADFDRSMATARGTLQSNTALWSVALILNDGTGFLYRRELADWPDSLTPRPVEAFSAIVTSLTNSTRLDRVGYYFRADNQEKQVMWTEAPALLDPRARPFWKAVEATQFAAWTPAYVLLLGGGSSLTYGGLGVSYSLPFFYSPTPLKRPGEAKMQGIISVLMEMKGLSEFLASLQVTESGFAVILGFDQSGQRYVIAYRDPAVLTRMTPGANGTAPSYSLTPVDQLPDPLLRAFVQALPEDTERRVALDPVSGLSVGVNDFSYGGRVYRSRYIPTRISSTAATLSAAGQSSDTSPGQLKILIGIVTPDDDIRALVYSSAKLSSIVGSVGFALVVAGAAAVSLEITRQLRHFAREVEAVAALRMAGGAADRRLGSVVKELDTFGAAVGKMRSLLAIVSGMMEAVFVLDGRGRVSRLNARALALFGAGRAEDVLFGATFAERFLDPADRASFTHLLRAGKGPGGAAAGTREFVCTQLGGGRRFPAEISVGHTRMEGGEVHVLVVRDASERHALLESLRESESKAVLLAHDLRCLIQYSNAPIFAVDPAGRVVEWNAAMAKATGCGREEALGQSVLAFVADEARPALSGSIEGVLERGREVANQEVDFLVRPAPPPPSAGIAASFAALPEGAAGGPEETAVVPYGAPEGPAPRRLVRLMVNAAGRRDLGGSIVGAICVGQDMSEKVRMIEMKAAAEAKARLIAYVCHEVRTPLNGITGMLQLLHDTDLDAEQHDYLQSMSQCSEQLLSVVNDLLDLSKLEAGMVKVESIAFDLRDVIEYVAELVAPAGYTKGIEIVCQVAPDIPTRVYGDPTRLRQILINLAHNACKFTTDGYVLIRCESAEAAALLQAGGQGTAQGRPGTPPRVGYTISVTDTGMGMDAAGVARLFQDFVQVNETITRKYGGTGMGLSISKQLAELMGGRIAASSALGVGTTFTVDLPFAPIVAASSPATPLPAAPGAAADRRPSSQLPSHPSELRLEPAVAVLVATACAPVREAVAAYLAALGCPVAFAPSAAAARGLLRGPQRFDVCIVDDGLPARDGEDAERAVLAFGPEPAAAAESGREEVAGPAAGSLSRRSRKGGPFAERAPGIASALLREIAGMSTREAEGGPWTGPVPVLLASINRRGSVLTASGHLRPLAAPEGSVPGTPHGPDAPDGRPPSWLAKPLRLVKLYLLLAAASRQAPARPAALPAGPASRRESAREPPPAPAPEAGPALAPLEVAEGRGAGGAGVPGWRPRILLVEDQALNQKIVEQMLRRVGLEIEVAWDGQEAVDRFAAGPAPDLILMDMQMPRLDGCEACIEIRRRETAAAARPDPPRPARTGRSTPRPHLPIVALTANAMSADERRCYSSGMDSVLKKPVKRDELLAVIEKFTPWRRPASIPSASSLGPAAPSSSSSLRPSSE